MCLCGRNESCNACSGPYESRPSDYKVQYDNGSNWWKEMMEARELANKYREAMRRIAEIPRDRGWHMSVAVDFARRVLKENESIIVTDNRESHFAG